MKTLRLILGDQLNSRHSWFGQRDPEVHYAMAEMRQETDYTTHHIQKVVAFFKSMRNFRDWLRSKGHNIHYFEINDLKNPQELEPLIRGLCKELQIGRFEYQLPDEYRLDSQLRSISQTLGIPCKAVDSEHFYTTRNEVAEFFEGKKQLVMENFYRMMRKKHDILMVGGEPDGGKWNFDQSNRKKWTGKPQVPALPQINSNVREVLRDIKTARIKTIGNIDPEHFIWPTAREDAEILLDHFCSKLLRHFGDYQDALHTQERLLFHSRLSFALNVKILSPQEVVNKVVDHYHGDETGIHISQIEGFVRQILGWREFMRGVYWKEMPDYEESNALDNHNPLPEFYWTGNTKMNCLSKAIGQSLDLAYAHHIQRLMVTGNFALLIQADPDAVDAWYLGIYIDAIQWVEITNTRGMSQYADGGIIATKPYISSANYINKMGNYCQNCHYDHKQRTGDAACPFNALYWNFLDEKRTYLEGNPRMGMMYRLLDKKSKEELKELKERATAIIGNPDLY